MGKHRDRKGLFRKLMRHKVVIYKMHAIRVEID